MATESTQPMWREHCAHGLVSTQWRRSLFLLALSRMPPGTAGPSWRSKPAETFLSLTSWQ